MLSREHRDAAALVARLVADAAKSINQAVNEYEDVLTRLAYDVLNGNTGEIDFRRAHKALLKSSAKSAFEEAWLESGGKLDDTEPEDVALIREFANEQSAFVNDFAKWLVETDENGKRNWEMKRRILAERIASWVLALRNFAERIAARAKGDPYLTYDGEDGEESCSDCQEYKGQRHRYSWWERRDLLKRNGNDNFECGRWKNCQHHFFYDNGEQAVE